MGKTEPKIEVLPPEPDIKDYFQKLIKVLELTKLIDWKDVPPVERMNAHALANLISNKIGE
jgi:hypothetical protein